MTAMATPVTLLNCDLPAGNNIDFAADAPPVTLFYAPLPTGLVSLYAPPTALQSLARKGPTPNRTHTTQPTDYSTFTTVVSSTNYASGRSRRAKRDCGYPAG